MRQQSEIHLNLQFFQHMLFNPPLIFLVDQIYRGTNMKSTLIKRCNNLSIKHSPQFTFQRISFIVAQTIYTIISDSIYPPSSKPKVTKCEQISYYHTQSMMDYSQICDTALLQIGVLITKQFSRLTLQQITQFLLVIMQQIRQHFPIMQIIPLTHPIILIPNIIAEYNCHCLSQWATTQCEQCNSLFHPGCQSQSFYCSACFLQHCLCDLYNRRNDPFGRHRQTFPYFCGYVRTASDRVTFHIVRFTIQNYSSIAAANSQQSIDIRIQNIVYDQNKSKRGIRRNLLKFMQYQLYLNQSKLQTSNNFRENSIIYQLQRRDIKAGENILVIKCKTKIEGISILGIYKIKKVKKERKKTKEIQQSKLVNSQSLINVKEISQIQAQQYANRHSLTQRIFTLVDPISKNKIITPVRSYICTHLQCFDYQVFRHCFLQHPQHNAQVPLIDPENINKMLKDIYKHYSYKWIGKNKKKQKKLFCPICKCHLTLLYVDPLVAKLLNKNSSSLEVIALNGKYNLLQNID